MKARVLVQFVDKETKALRKVGSIIEVTEARFNEILSVGKFIEPATESVSAEMTLEELKEYAKEKGIDLNGARTKAAIIKAINAAE